MDGNTAAIHGNKPIDTYQQRNSHPFIPQHIAITVLPEQKARIYPDYLHANTNKHRNGNEQDKPPVRARLCPKQQYKHQ